MCLNGWKSITQNDDRNLCLLQFFNSMGDWFWLFIGFATFVCNSALMPSHVNNWMTERQRHILQTILSFHQELVIEVEFSSYYFLSSFWFFYLCQHWAMLYCTVLFCAELCCTVPSYAVPFHAEAKLCCVELCYSELSTTHYRYMKLNSDYGIKIRWANWKYKAAGIITSNEIKFAEWSIWRRQSNPRIKLKRQRSTTN